MSVQRDKKQVYKYSPFSNLPNEILERRTIVKTISGISVTMLIYFLLSTNLYSALCTVLRFSGVDFYSGSANAEISSQICFFVSYIFTYTIPTLILYFILDYQYRFAKMFRVPNKSILICSFPIILAVGILVGTGINLIQSLLSYFGIFVLQDAIVYPDSMPAGILYAVNATILPAAAEEFYFHGVVFHSLRKHGDSFAILISSMLFAIAHKSPFQAMYAFVSAMVIGYFIIRTGSLLTGMILHFANNILTLTLDYSISMSLSPVSISLIHIVVLVLASICIIILVNRDRNIFTIHDKKTNFSISSKIKYAFGNVFFLFVLSIFLANVFISFTLI